ncbi:MAG TPA: PQQ-binding-like beta-propeller repeat protein, partial [Candidatus Sulfotelmatobacter sp.]|nr:PQQ-binding-like beta-propeller repeat protein [Candidatus Sulfotelmatobacter sp.]
MKGLTQWLGALSAAVLYLNTGNLQAGDYPQWRGPQRNGVSPETGLLKEWPKEGPKLLWKVSDLGLGYSTPAVAGERLYVLKNEGLENESVVALNSKEGKSVWSARLGQVGNPKQQPNYPAARSTPTVDGELVYALGSDGDLFCLEAATGKARWHKSLRADFEGEPGKWAYAESPLIDRQTLVCAPGGSNATVIALNKQTGDLIWKCAVPGGDQAAYASAIISQAGGVKQYVLFLQKALVGVEAKTGKFLWRYDKTAKNSSANIPTPLADGDYVYSAAGRSGGGLIKLKANAGAFEVEEVCFSQKLPTSIGGAVKVG